MQCPICKQNLVMTERQGVEIDYCPSCRGVWLDRGELDKILEKSASFSTPQPSQSNNYPSQPPYQQSREHHNTHSNQSSNTHYGQPHHKKKESWLGDIFDF